jgi:predicted nucleotidyltransferase
MQRRLWTYLVNHPLISMRFKTLLDRIKPLQSEVDKARVHVALIRNRLSRYFDVRKSFLVGSHWKGTAIKTFSDIDVFVVMSRDEGRRWPAMDLLKRFLIEFGIICKSGFRKRPLDAMARPSLWLLGSASMGLMWFRRRLAGSGYF